MELKKFAEYKRKYPDVILLFRCGDFYEAYNEDAQACSQILGVNYVKTDLFDRGIFAGFPYRAISKYLPRLIRAGKRVAICDPL